MKKILLIYTGGTIGMTKDYESMTLKPFDFQNISEKIPELNLIDAALDIYSFDSLIDSSDMNMEGWRNIAEVIYDKYDDYHGFVVLHGTDTMSYAASALSFMLQGLKKPIIFTGSQLPIGELRTDAKENLISSIHFAALSNEENQPLIHEVCIYFEYKLYRGNRTVKMSSNHFDAFKSPNFPTLGESGVYLTLNKEALLIQRKSQLRYYPNLSGEIALIKIYPSMSLEFLINTLNLKNLKVLIIEAFGAGNIFSNPTFNKKLKEKTKEGLHIIIGTQCVYGGVEIGKYEASSIWLRVNAISAKDMTTEAAITKAMHILGNPESYPDFTAAFNKNMSGEHTSSEINFS
ncbi:type I asparaginase [Flavobacteriaceae bacterium Ap0902]|nr:type I asparaginase [Flavobacteriaceae bacterium Ap0902]